MGRHVAFTGLLLAVVAILFLCFNSPASAVEPVPGNACGTGGNITNSFMWAGAPENGGITNGMFCDGAHWKGVINFQSSGYIGIGTTSPTAQLQVVTSATGASSALNATNNGAANTGYAGYFSNTSSATASPIYGVYSTIADGDL